LSIVSFDFDRDDDVEPVLEPAELEREELPREELLRGDFAIFSSLRR